jgi:RNA polymerase sigma factor (sigma-70 family)
MPAMNLGSVLQHLRKLAGAKLSGDLTDAQLLQRFREQREESAFTLLVQRHGPMVLGVCRRILGDVHATEDAFQATFLVLVRRAGQICWRDSIANWLYTTSVRVARKARSRSARTSALEKKPMIVQNTSAPDPLTMYELRALLDEELERLPRKFRSPLVLCYLEEKTQEQAARELGCPKSTLSSRMARGRELLRGRLVRRGVTVSSMLLASALTEQAAPAALPALLTLETVRAAMAVLGGKALAGLVSAQAAELADGVMRGILAANLKVTLVLFLLLAGVFSGAAVLGKHGGEGEAGRPPRDAVPHAQAPHAEAPRPEPVAEVLRTDHYGDPLPPGAVARLGSLRFYHGQQVTRVTLSPDEKLVVSCGRDRNRLWDATSGRELPVRDEWKNATFFAASGKLVAVQRMEGAVQLWDVTQDRKIGRFALHSSIGFSYSLSPDGKTFVASSLEAAFQNTLRFCDVDRGHVGEPIPLQMNDQTREFAFSADSKTLVVAHGNSKVQVWDVPTRTKRRESLPDLDKFGGFLALSPDGKVLATGPFGSTQIRLWDVGTLAELPPLLDQPKLTVQPLAFSPDGKTLAATYPSPVIRLWDLTTRKEIKQIRGKSSQVYHTVFSADGKTLAGADGESVTLWDAATGKFRHDFGHTYCVAGLAFSPDGNSLVSGAAYTDRTLRVWHPLTGRQTGQWHGHADGMEAVAFSPDGKLVASGSQDRTIRLWEFLTGKEIRRLEAKDGMVYGMAFAPDGKTIASGGWRKAVHLWDVASGRELRAINNPGDWVLRVAFSPDGKTIATRGIGETIIRLWDAAGGKELRRLPDAAAGCPSLDFSPDGTLLAAGGDDDHSALGHRRRR